MTADMREVKLCLLGESGVGKSSIVHRLVHEKFTPHSENTIGAAFFTKSVTLETTIYKYLIWDTAGQEKFRAMTPMYYRGTSVAVIVYDITVKDSFDAVQIWLNDLRKYADSDVIIAIAGNKCDLEEKRKVLFKDALEFATSQNAIFVETSAKTAVNVATLFIEISECLATKAANKDTAHFSTMQNSSAIVIPRSSQSRRRSCCASPLLKF